MEKPCLKKLYSKDILKKKTIKMRTNPLAKIDWQKMLLCVLVLCSSALLQQLRAQVSVTGAVNGIVRSEAGKPLVGISVVATNLTSGLTSGTSTDTGGVFTFTKLPANGRYSFAFSGVGFESQTLRGYDVKGGGTVSIIVRLKETAGQLPRDSKEPFPI
jgi:hypothetical protein